MLRHALIAIVVLFGVFAVFETGLVEGEDIAGLLDAGTDAVEDTPPEQLYQMIGTTTGQFELLISDQPTVIDDFNTLEVTFNAARVYPENSSAGGPQELTLDQPTVDLTAVQGDRATPIVETVLDPGTYQKIELEVTEVHAVLDDGGTASYRGSDAEADGDTTETAVYTPTDRIAVTKAFEIMGNDDTAFVFDIDIVSRGETDDYILLPNTGESGVAGEDTAVERVTPDGE